MKNLRLSLLTILTVLLFNSCSDGEIAELEQELATTIANYLVLDLNTGAVTANETIADLADNGTYRTDKMVFRLVDAGTLNYGSASDSFGHQGDEAQGSIALNKYYLAVFEITQEQWRRIAGASNEPWTDVDTSSLSSAAFNNNKPAFGLSREIINNVVASYQQNVGAIVRLPTDEQWEFACRAGSSAVFTWGDALDTLTISAHAAVWDSLNGALTPDDVGARSANAFGVYDMHGNIWELTSGDHMRGGSWHDPIAQARCANTVSIDDDHAHVLVGARLVLQP